MSNATLSRESNKTTGRGSRKNSFKIIPYVMIAPALTILGFFVIYPIFYMIYLSMFKWDIITDKIFVGFNNFRDIFASKDFWEVTFNTLTYTFWTVLFSIGLAILLALYLKPNNWVNKILQSVVFSPYVISLVSVSFIWMWLMDSQYGLLNYMLELIGIGPVRWLDSPDVALYSLILVTVWKSVGYNTLIILSAMQGVPSSLYEAANLDKAKKSSIFFKITLPMISPTLFALILLNLIAAFKVFETVNIMTQGGPMKSTTTLVYQIYRHGFEFYRIGYASAMGVVLMVIIGLCTVLYFALLQRRVHYN